MHLPPQRFNSIRRKVIAMTGGDHSPLSHFQLGIQRVVALRTGEQSTMLFREYWQRLGCKSGLIALSVGIATLSGTAAVGHNLTSPARVESHMRYYDQVQYRNDMDRKYGRDWEGKDEGGEEPDEYTGRGDSTTRQDPYRNPSATEGNNRCRRDYAFNTRYSAMRDTVRALESQGYCVDSVERTGRNEYEVRSNRRGKQYAHIYNGSGQILEEQRIR
jgi:hypothetical protein